MTYDGRNDDGHRYREDEQRYSELVKESETRENIGSRKTRAFQNVESTKCHQRDKSWRGMSQESWNQN